MPPCRRSLAHPHCRNFNCNDAFHAVPKLSDLFPASPIDAAISLWDGARATESRRTTTVAGILKEIKTGRWAEQIARLRMLPWDEFKKAKTHLVAFSLSGTFAARGGAGLMHHSGWLQIDIDAGHGENDGLDVKQVAEQLWNDPAVGFGFVSCSGTGYKAGIRIDGARHLESFLAAEQYFRDRHGLKIDPSTKDVGRLCFISHDPDCWWKPTDIFAIPEGITGITPNDTRGRGAGVPDSSDPEHDLTDDDIREVLKAIPSPVKGQYDQWLRIASGVFNYFGSFEPAVTLLAEWAPEIEPGEYQYKWTHRLVEIGIGTVIHIAQEHGFDAAAAARRRNKRGAVLFGVPHGTTAETSQNVPEAQSVPSKAVDPNAERFLLPNDYLGFVVAAKEIFSTIAPTHTLFSRGNNVVEIVDEADGGKSCELMSASRFRSVIEEYGRDIRHLVKANKFLVEVPRRCSEANACALLDSTPARILLPKIRLIAHAPVAVEVDGEIRILGPGHHEEHGGIYVWGGKLPPAIDKEKASESLMELLEEFDFVTPGDHGRAVASLITPALIMGGWVPGPPPVDMAEADVSQSGKTYRQKLVRAIYRETAYSVGQKHGGVGSFDETLSAALISGRSFVAIDNFRGHVDSPFFEMVLTAKDPVPCRVPHRGEVFVDHRRVTFQLTSNGIDTTRDLTNRSSIIRIKKRPTNQFRQFPEGDLLAHVEANQPYYLGCVFGILNAWAHEGKPTTRTIDHDFRFWAGPVDYICQQYFGFDPIFSDHRNVQERASNPAMNWIRSVAIAIIASGRSGDALTASEIFTIAEEADLDPRGGGNSQEEGFRAVGKIMGKAFKNGNEIHIDHMRIIRTETTETDEWRKNWIQKRYSVYGN
jgi:hypothetical protein